MEQFTLPLLAAKQMAQALLPHVGRDDVTPVLTGVLVGVGENRQYAFATDRYTVGRFDLSNLYTEEPTGEVWVHHKALSAVAALGKATLLDSDSNSTSYHVTFRTGKDELMRWTTTVTVEYRPDSERVPNQIHWMRVFGALGADGNYPPVSRLLESFLPGEQMRVGLSYEHLAKFRPTERNGVPLRITLAKTPTGPGAKLSPILVESGTRFKGLIQPALLLNEAGYGEDLAMANRLRDEEAQAKAASATEPTPESETKK